eukprot:11706502-Ditylum_brightwellii.AAC.1
MVKHFMEKASYFYHERKRRKNINSTVARLQEMANISPTRHHTIKRNKRDKPIISFKRLDRPMDIHVHFRLKGCNMRP